MALTFLSRKLFLDGLGTEFIGLSSSVSAFFSLLNISELGLGAAASYLLYLPLKNNDTKSVSEIVASFSCIYKWIGVGIAVIGVLTSFFLSAILGPHSLDTRIVYFLFYTFLVSACIPYILSSRQIILSADQSQYIITGIVQLSNVGKVLIQIFFIYVYCNPYIWVVVELIFAFVVSLLINISINKKYAYLSGECSKYYIYELFRHTKKVAIQKLSWVARYQLTELMILKFSVLSYVAMYQNYALLSTRLISLSSQAYSGLPASVGNLIAEGDGSRMMTVFRESAYMRIFTTSFVISGLYTFADSLISLWLGEQYILETGVLACLCISAYVDHLRSICESFLFAGGLFNDSLVAVVEVIMTVILSLTLGEFYGIVGVLYGLMLSNVIIGFVWKPYYLYSILFNKKLSHFYVLILPPMVISFLSYCVTVKLLSAAIEMSASSWSQFIFAGIQFSILYLIMSLIMYWLLFYNFRTFLRRLLK